MKRFALPDTPGSPYFTIDAADAEVTVKIAEAGERMTVEIWRDGQILCRIFARNVRIDSPQHTANQFPGDGQCPK